jgi:Icc-related predicted phosphoesterase
MKIWFISDTHGKHSELKIPEYDLLIHCGDEANSVDPNKNERESRDFFEWFDWLPGDKVFIPGNHSVSMSNGRVKPKSIVIKDRLINISGINIYGSPWCPSIKNGRWPYSLSRDKMHPVWDLIPNNQDELRPNNIPFVLATHTPPKGILDLARDYGGNNQVHCGCRSLFNKVLSIKPNIHCFGHMHSQDDNHNSGIYKYYGITFINCSVVNNRYELINDGFLINYDIESHTIT